MVGRPLGPAWAGGSGQNPDQASETLDSSPGRGPTSKLISEGRVLKINGRLKKARSPQATGRGSRQATTARRSRRSPGSCHLGGQEAGRALRPRQVEPGRGYLSPACPRTHVAPGPVPPPTASDFLTLSQPGSCRDLTLEETLGLSPESLFGHWARSLGFAPSSE